jgi:CBS domain-containing protein
MLIEDLATRPAVTCTRSTTIGAVAKLLAADDIGCIVVVDDDGRPLGVCTDRDLVVRALAGSWPEQTPVHCAMTEPAVTVRVGTDAADALASMRLHRVRRVPVIDADGRVEGVVSLDDLTARLAGELDDVALAAAPRPHRRSGA